MIPVAFEWLWFIVIGIAAGWLASALVKGYGFGLVGNLVLGVIGALVGGFLFGRFLIPGGGIGTLIAATIGAVIFLVIVRIVKRA